MPECKWHHTGPHGHFEFAVRELGSTTCCIDDSRVVAPLVPNMHAVVERYVKPWTEDFSDVGLALVLNAGGVSTHKENSLQKYCKAEVFISHCWNEPFELFAKTLMRSFDPETIVWVCSFAICQHGDVGGQLTSL